MPMTMSALFSLAWAVHGGIAVPDLATAEHPQDPLSAATEASAEPASTETIAGDEATGIPPELGAWASALGPILIRNVNTGSSGSVRLYRDDGVIDPAAEREFMRVVSSGVSADEQPHTVTRRLMQLVVKAAYHLRANEIDAISAFRPEQRAPKPGHMGSRHATGDAIDFRVPGVDAKILASLLRSYPRAGVGIYTHPRTQYVHLDVRDESFHWIDGSPPRVSWRERGLADPGRVKRDACWVPELDLPLDLE